jgi:hypothetical protein
MNVNNIMMAAGRRWRAPGKVALTSTDHKYRIWPPLARKNQKWLAGPDLNVSQAGRKMAPQELMRDGEVNHLSVESSDLTR